MKKTYEAPVLSEWGEVTKITQGWGNRKRWRERRRRRLQKLMQNGTGGSFSSCGSH